MYRVYVRAIWITKVTWGFSVAPLNATKCRLVPVCVPVVSRSFSEAGEKVSWEGGRVDHGAWGLNHTLSPIKSSNLLLFLEARAQVQDSGLHLLSGCTTTYGLFTNESLWSACACQVHVSCLQSPLGTRWPRTRNVGLILMIKPQCFVGTVNWKKKKTHTSYYDLKAWFLFAVNCRHTIKAQLAWKIILSHSCDPKPCLCHFYVASHALLCMHANRGQQYDTAAQCTVRKCL